MKLHSKRLHIFFFILFAINIIWDIYLYTLPTKTTIWNYLFNVTYGCLYLIGGIVSIWYGVKFGLKSNVGKVLLFLGMSLLTYEMGNLIWAYYNLILKVSIPFPSLADVSYVLFYPVAGVGCFFLLRLYKSAITRSVIRDSLIIIVVAFIAVFGFFSKPDISQHLSLIEKIINVLYPTGDVILISMSLIALRVGGGKIHRSLYIFYSGLLFFTLADFIFVYRNANSTYWNGDIADLLYTCGGYVISVGLFEVIKSLTHETIVPVKQEQAAGIESPNPMPSPAASLNPTTSPESKFQQR